MSSTNISGHDNKPVVPTKAGTHRPRVHHLSMGPRLRGDDEFRAFQMSSTNIFGHDNKTVVPAKAHCCPE